MNFRRYYDKIYLWYYYECSMNSPIFVRVPLILSPLNFEYIYIFLSTFFQNSLLTTFLHSPIFMGIIFQLPIQLKPLTLHRIKFQMGQCSLQSIHKYLVFLKFLKASISIWINHTPEIRPDATAHTAERYSPWALGWAYTRLAQLSTTWRLFE